MNVTRRKFLTGLGAGLLASSTMMPALGRTTCQRISGFGSYLLGPFDPVVDGAEPVYLTTDLGFDESALFCKVSTNYAPFKFPTARLGVVEFDAYEFFMDMQSTSINSLTIEETDMGYVANFQGILRSVTRLYNGDRAVEYVEEDISFGCLATELAPRVSVSEENFSMMASFDPVKGQAAIFGPEATFAGRLTVGQITVAP